LTLAPPYNEEAEQAVLGAMLTNVSAVPVALDRLSATDFYLGKHGDVFAAVEKLWGQHREIDATIVAAALPDEKDYVHLLSDSCLVATNVGEYARIVHDLAQRRLLLRTGQEIAQLAHSEDDIKALVDRAEQKVFSISPSRHDKPQQAQELLAEILMEQDEGVPADSVPTGFKGVDELLGGLHPCSLVIIGARPGIGKTSFALAIAKNVAKLGRVLFFSLEMGRTDLAERLGCSLSSVNLRHVREHNLHPDERARLTKAMSEVELMDLIFDDEPGQTLHSVRGAARRAASKKPLALVVVDYLQLMRLGQRTESRYVEVSAMSRELKNLARQIKCPVIALSRLNRESESHFSDGRPKLSNLRESGSIEQDADAVMLLSWPKDDKRTVIVDVAKNRHGPLGEVRLNWTPQYTRFHDQ